MGIIYEQLNIEERTIIQTQLEMGIKPAAIAKGMAVPAPHTAALQELSMRDESVIRHFVRTSLGCACPDAVFEQIEHTDNPVVSRAQPYAVRMTIGGRLLIYRVGRAQFDGARLKLDDILVAGRSDRDAHDYNRFRAVIIDASPAELHGPLLTEWQRLVAGEKRLHLHVVHPDNMRAITALAAGESML
jgi:hypothetical protein